MQCIHNIQYTNLELVQHYNELVQHYKCFFGLLSRNWIIPNIILSSRSKNQFFGFQCFHFTGYTFFEKQPFPRDYFRKLFEKVTCFFCCACQLYLFYSWSALKKFDLYLDFYILRNFYIFQNFSFHCLASTSQCTTHNSCLILTGIEKVDNESTTILEGKKSIFFVAQIMAVFVNSSWGRRGGW